MLLRSYLKSMVVTKLGGLDIYRLKRKGSGGKEAGPFTLKIPTSSSSLSLYIYIYKSNNGPTMQTY